jgi:tryptophanyl-tRNA synthetase
VTDDEKFVFNQNLSLETTIKMGKENIKDIIAFGFDPEKTFIFSDVDYIKELYPNVLRVQKNITAN